MVRTVVVASVEDVDSGNVVGFWVVTVVTFVVEVSVVATVVAFAVVVWTSVVEEIGALVTTIFVEVTGVVFAVVESAFAAVFTSFSGRLVVTTAALAVSFCASTTDAMRRRARQNPASSCTFQGREALMSTRRRMLRRPQQF